jgi:anti-anti-sigma factor
MEIKTEKQGDITVLSLIGRLDSPAAPESQEKMMPVLNQGSRFVIDACKLEYVSSAGLRVLLLAAKKVAAKDGKAVMAGLSEEIKDIMKMTGFDHMFEYHPDVASASKALA